MANYLLFQFQSDDMAKFDSIRMADLTEVQDPDKDGGITLAVSYTHLTLPTNREV